MKILTLLWKTCLYQIYTIFFKFKYSRIKNKISYNMYEDINNFLMYVCIFCYINKMSPRFKHWIFKQNYFVIVKNYNTNQVGKHYFINRSLSLKLLHKAKCEREMQIFGITNPFSINVILNFKMIFALIVANLNFTNLAPPCNRYVYQLWVFVFLCTISSLFIIHPCNHVA